jgi:transposase
MMSTPAPQPATTPIPVQLSEPEFEAFILPHLSMPRRGPKCKLGYYRVFNLILWVLYTGMQWKCLPVPQDGQGKPAIHYTYCMPRFCPPLHDVMCCEYNRFPTRTQHWQGKSRRRKDDTDVGTTARGVVGRLHRVP